MATLTSPARLYLVPAAMPRGLTEDTLLSLLDTGTLLLFVLILVADSDY